MPLTADEINHALDAWFSAALDAAFRQKSDGTFAIGVLPGGSSHDELHDLNLSMIRDDAENRIEHLQADYRRHDFGAGRGVARSIIDALSPGAAAAHPQLAEAVAKRVVEALGSIEEARGRWSQGDVDYRPTRHMESSANNPAASADLPAAGGVLPAVLPVAAPAAVSGADDEPTLGECLETFLAIDEKRPGRMLKHHAQMASHLKLLVDVFRSDRTIASITRKEAGAIYEGMQFLPAGFRQHPQLSGLTFAQAVARSRSEGLKPMNSGTANTYLGEMRAFFEHLVKTGVCSQNPFTKMNIKKTKAPRSSRTFSNVELSKIFGGAFFMGAKSEKRPYAPGSHLINNWNFWAALIALTTGARISEIIQLRPQDIRQTDGVWVFDVNDEDGKRTKTQSSVRIVPVHPELHRIGILGLAAAQRARGHLTLLPEAPKPVRGVPSKQASQWMTERFLPALGIDWDGAGFHSFRHCFITAARDAGVVQETVDAMTGHANGAVRSKYGENRAPMLLRALEQLKMPPELALIPARYPAGVAIPDSGVAPSRQLAPDAAATQQTI